MSERNLSTRRVQIFGDVKKGTECRLCGRNVEDGRSKHCSDYCREIVEAVMQLLNWSSVRRRILKRDGMVCQECGFDFTWFERGERHLWQMIEDEIGEAPKGPSALALGNDEVPDDELERYRERWREWAEKRDEFKERYNYHAPRPDRYPNRPEVDHIEPVSRGGHPFDPANLRTLCSDCHAEKTAEENTGRERPNQMERPEASLIEFIAPGGDPDR